MASVQEANVRYARILVTAFCVVNLLLLSYWVAWPLLDTLWEWPNYTGASVDNTLYRWSWWILAFMTLNLLPPLLLMGSIAEPLQISRADFHWVVTFIVGLLTLVAVLTIFPFYYLFNMNTVWSGREPFNDPNWCCVFSADRPELCPNLPGSDCIPTPLTSSADLHISSLFRQHLAFGVTFLVLLIGHIGFNRYIRSQQVLVKGGETAQEGRILGLIYALLFTGLYAWWVAWPLLDTIYLNGYPQIAIPPGPGPYISYLYDWQWWLTTFPMTLTILSPALFMAALANTEVSAAGFFHYWVSVVIAIGLIISSLSFVGIYFFWCNNGPFWFSWYLTPNSICNSYEWCCENWPTFPPQCANVGPCADSPVTLFPNPEFTTNLVVSLLFNAGCFIGWWLNIRMQQYGAFYPRSI